MEEHRGIQSQNELKFWENVMDQPRGFCRVFLEQPWVGDEKNTEFSHLQACDRDSRHFSGASITKGETKMRRISKGS